MQFENKLPNGNGSPVIWSDVCVNDAMLKFSTYTT